MTFTESNTVEALVRDILCGGVIHHTAVGPGLARRHGALSGLGVDADPALLAMVNGEAVPRDQWSETPLSPDDTISLFRPFKGG